MGERGTNLRDDGTLFVGREPERARIEDLLARGARLITVVGPPGIGKSRLARRAALDWRARSGGGAWSCEPGEAGTAEAIAAAVAAALGAPDLVRSAADDPAGLVAGLLVEAGPLLLLLDGAESAAKAVASCVEIWLDRAPAARFLVSSRERLGLPSERLIDLGGLSLQPGEDGRSAAVALFCDRAEAVGAPPADAAGRRSIERIVAALDGIPLAIELAAARSRVLSPGQILEQLPGALDLFRRGRPDSPRHATLRAAIDWSWRLLAPWEQRALVQLSVLVGDFGLDAARGVIDLAGGPSAPEVPDAPEPPEVIDVLQALCDRSLVTAEREPGAGGERRFRCYGVIRDYAAEALVRSGLEGPARGRHLQHFAGRAARWFEDSKGTAGATARALLRQERGNLLAAHAWALEASDPSQVDRALAMLPAIEVAVADQPLERYRLLLDRSIEVADAGGAAPERLARALLARVRASFAQARVDVRDAERALHLLGPDGDPRLRGLAWYYGGHAWWYRGDLDRTRDSFEQAAGLFAVEPPSHLWPHALSDLATVLVELGEHDAARDRGERALDIAARMAAPPGEWVALCAAVALAQGEGHLDEAARLAGRALAIATELGEGWREVASLHDLAAIERGRGDIDAATAWVERAGGRLERLGWPLQQTFHGVAQALLAQERGGDEAAARLMAELCERFRAAGFARRYALLLAHRAASLAALGRVEEARLALEKSRAGLDPSRALDAALLDLAAAHLELAGGGAEAPPAAARARVEELVASAWRRLGAGRPEDPARVPVAGAVDLRLLRRRLDARARALADDHRRSILLDGSRHELRAGDKVLALRSRPALRKLLYALARRPGEPVGREELVRAVWGGERAEGKHDGALKANVHNLRRALRDTGLEVESSGDGYCLRAPAGFETRGI